MGASSRNSAGRRSRFQAVTAGNNSTTITGSTTNQLHTRATGRRAPRAATNGLKTRTAEANHSCWASAAGTRKKTSVSNHVAVQKQAANRPHVQAETSVVFESTTRTRSRGRALDTISTLAISRNSGSISIYANGAVARQKASRNSIRLLRSPDLAGSHLFFADSVTRNAFPGRIAR